MRHIKLIFKKPKLGNIPGLHNKQPEYLELASDPDDIPDIPDLLLNHSFPKCEQNQLHFHDDSKLAELKEINVIPTE